MQGACVLEDIAEHGFFSEQSGRTAGMPEDDVAARLDLTGADVVIHYDPWWNLAVQNQATDRAHRIGQNKTVTVYKMIVSHSIEEKIEKLQNAKQNLAEQVMNADMGNLSSMTREELLELLEC